MPVWLLVRSAAAYSNTTPSCVPTLQRHLHPSVPERASAACADHAVAGWLSSQFSSK